MVTRDDDEAPSGVERHGDGRSTINLLKPVEHEGQVVNKIDIREVIGADLIKSDKAKGDMERGILLLASVSGQPVSVIKLLRAKDIERLMEEVDHLKNA